MATKKVIPEEVGTYVVGLSEELKKVFPYNLDGKCQPELIVMRSEILDIEDVVNISTHILGETSWALAYSTSLHPHSLTGMYDKINSFYEVNFHNLLILVKDREKRLFGIFNSTKLNCALEKYPAEHSVLFQCQPEFEVIGDNQCNVMCRSDLLEIADSEGKYRIWFDKNLTGGGLEESQKNVASAPAPAELKVYPFQIKTLECWIFGKP